MNEIFVDLNIKKYIDLAIVINEENWGNVFIKTFKIDTCRLYKACCVF